MKIGKLLGKIFRIGTKVVEAAPAVELAIEAGKAVVDEVKPKKKQKVEE